MGCNNAMQAIGSATPYARPPGTSGQRQVRRPEAPAPLTGHRPQRREFAITPSAPAERVLEGEYIAGSTSPSLSPVYGPRITDVSAQAASNDQDDIGPGSAMKAIYAYLLAANTTDGITGLRIDGYA